MRTRRQRPTLTAAFAAAAFIAVAIASLPASLLRLALDRAGGGFEYTSLSGTIWTGEIRGAAAGDLDLGDIGFMVDPLALLVGRLRVDARITGGDIEGAGVVSLRADRTLDIRSARIDVDLARTSRRYALLGAAIEGAASVRIDRLRVDGRGHCVESAGRLWTDILRGPARAFDGEAFDLQGPLACEDGRLRASLGGRGSEGAVSLDLSVDPQMRYFLSVEAVPRRREVDEALRAVGFERGPAGLTYSATGVFNGV